MGISSRPPREFSLTSAGTTKSGQVNYLYSNEGGVDAMFFQKAGGSAPSISQAEINRVIQSIRKVPTQSVASN
jgi:hypothetical protein